MNWFFENKLLPHFEIEESAVFPILGRNHSLVKIALDQHDQLVALFRRTTDSPDVLEQIADALENHIRFEERQLFNKIQETASDEEWVKTEEVHGSRSQNCENWPDEFWNESNQLEK